jgi:hypothetical protein
MAFVGTQTLEYREHRDELACLSRALTLLQQNDVCGAKELLVVRHAQLIADQQPTLKVYDPRSVRI